MKYLIAYLLSGKAKQYNEKLIRQFANEFNEKYLLTNKKKPHITLKYSFRTKQIKAIEKLLKEFCEKQRPAKIKIRKINNFSRKVIYLQLDFSKDAMKIYDGLKRELKKVRWLPWRKEDDIKGKFHATIVYANTPANFKKIWKYVSKLKPRLDLKLDNITIIKKSDKFWKIHKMYKLR